MAGWYCSGAHRLYCNESTRTRSGGYLRGVRRVSERRLMAFGYSVIGLERASKRRQARDGAIHS